MSEDRPKKLNLSRFVRGSANHVADISLADHRNTVREVEERMARARDRLWEREWAVMTLRGVLRETAEREGEDVEVLRAKVSAIRDDLVEADRLEMAPLQAQIASGAYARAELFAELDRRPRFEWDAFIERALGIAEPPRPEKSREKDMVHYLASPLEVVLELVGELKDGDVLYDLGAGLGKVTMCTGWLSPARSKGVEMDPAYARTAGEQIARLGFERAQMICADAREVDYSDGTAFYFYDPFRGAILDAVLAKIRAGSEGRKIKVYSRGGSTASIDLVPWLERSNAYESGLTVYTRAGA